MYYVELDSIAVDCEMLILDNGNLVLASLIDYAIKNRKAVADFIDGGNFYLENFDNNQKTRFYTNKNTKYTFRSTKMGERSHTVIKLQNMEDIFIHWGDSDLYEAAAKYIQNVLFIPVTNEMAKSLLGTKSAYALTVISDNPTIKPVAYKFSKSSVINALSRLKCNLENSYSNWEDVNTTEDYIIKFIEPVKKKVRQNISVMYDGDPPESKIFEGEMKPMDGQVSIIQSALEVLKRDRFVYLASQMGSGKTLMGAKINHNCHSKKNYVTLSIVPTTTIKNWAKELRASILGDVDIHIIERTSDFIKIYNKGFVFDKPTYFLVGKETLKLDAFKKPGVNYKTRVVTSEEKNIRGYTVDKEERIEAAFCPSCGEVLVNPLRVCRTILKRSDFSDNKPKKSNYKCSSCQEVLWQSAYDKTKKTSLIHFIKTKNIKFDSIIHDEVHQSNNSGSIIGNATRALIGFGTKNIFLSGTTNNGYASSFHNLMMALRPKMLKKDECLNDQDFIKKYGTLIGVKAEKDVKYKQYGRIAMNDSDYREAEGINPLFFTKYLAGNYIFSTLSELRDDLPEIKEFYVPVQADESLRYNTSNLISMFKGANPLAWKMYDNTIVRHYINNPQGWETIIVNGKEGEFAISPRNINFITLPKDDEVLRIVKAEIAEGRKVCIYTDFSGIDSSKYMKGPNIPRRIKSVLVEQGIRCLILDTSVKAIDRKDYIDKNTDNYDVIICNPKLVEVGVNLQAFPTYINYMPNYQVNVVDQSNRRGYRINSTLENRIYHLYYDGTTEQDMIERYQLKKVESKAIESQFNIIIQDSVSRTASSLSKKIDSVVGK